jgi:hypothetical protein
MAQTSRKKCSERPPAGRLLLLLLIMNLPKSPFDDRKRRCPRLGHPVRFDYCRIGGENRRPCFKVFDCWWEKFDVVGYFRRHLTPEAFESLACASPPDKTASLVDLIRKAKQRTATEK